MDKQQKQPEGVPFQSRAQLVALQVHAYWEKFENIVLYPFRKAADYFGQTHIFREQPTLRIVK